MEKQSLKKNNLSPLRILAVCSGLFLFISTPFSVSAEALPLPPPTELTATIASSTIVVLTWKAPSDLVIPVNEYYIYQGGEKSYTTENTSYTVEGLTPSTAYTFSVTATYGFVKSESNESNNVTVITNSDDGTPAPPPAISLAQQIASTTRAQYEKAREESVKFTEQFTTEAQNEAKKTNDAATLKLIEDQKCVVPDSILQTFYEIYNLDGELCGDGTPPASASSFAPATLTRNLSLGDRGADALLLQQILNQSADTQVASIGPGSPGNETSYFGLLTKAAVIKFQEKYADEILAPLGLASGTGFVGPATRKVLMRLAGG